jgi:hypothetical protein
LPGAHPSDTVREVNGTHDRSGGALHFEVIELAVFVDARHGLPCSHKSACGRALRAFLDRRVPSVA